MEGCSSTFMRLAEHLTALRTWCKQCLPGWCKPDVLRPGILGMQGSYQYGHTTTAMHKLSTHTPSAPVKSCQSSRELDNQGTVIFLFFGGHLDGYLVRSYFAGWRTLTPQRGMIASHSANMVRHPRGSYIVIPIAVSGVATPENKVTHRRCHPQTRK